MPEWFFHKDLYFPQEVYVSALGVGTTLQFSRENAISELILYFDSHISVNTTSELSIQETKNSFAKRKNLSQQVSVASEGELPSLLFTDAFFDKDRKEWYVLAYIKKDEFVKISLQEVQKGIAEVETTLTRLKSSSLFLQFISLSKVLKDLEALQRRAKHISVLDVENGKRVHSAIIKLKNASFSQREGLKSQLTFSIHIENDFEDIVSTALEEILENEGFIRSSNAKLILRGELKTSITKNSAGIFATPRLFVQIIDARNGGASIASYTKAYKKWGHISEEGAIKKACVEVEKDLRQHFIDFIYSL